MALTALACCWGCAATQRRAPAAARPGPGAVASVPAALEQADRAEAAGRWGASFGALRDVVRASGDDGGGALRTRLERLLREAPPAIAACGLVSLAGPGREDLVHDGIDALRTRLHAPGALPVAGLELDLEDLEAGRVGPPSGSPPDSMTVRAVLPLSGPSRGYSEALIWGLRAGLAGTAVRVEPVDGGADLVTMSRAASQAASGCLPGLMLGAALSGPTAVVAAAAQASGTPLLSPSAGEERIAGLGDWIFSTVPVRSLQGQELGRFMVEKASLHKAAVLVPEGTHADGLARGFRAAVSRLLGAPVPIFRYRDATRIGRIAEQLRELKPEAVLVDGDQGEVLAIEAQLAYYEVHTRLIGGEEFRPNRIPREAISRFEGAIYAEPSWVFAPGAGTDPYPAWRAAQSAREAARSAAAVPGASPGSSGAGEPEQAEQQDARDALSKGYAAGKVVAWLSTRTFVGRHGVQTLLRNLRISLEADSTLNVLAPPGAHLPILQIAEGTARPLPAP